MSASCPILVELCRDFEIPIPPHDTDLTLNRAYILADWAARRFLPKLLRYDDGRQTFPEYAAMLENLKPITDPCTAHAALYLLHSMISPAVAPHRDGSMAPPCRQAFWLCMAAKAFQEGYCLPAAFGASGLFDIAEALGIPVDGEREKLMELLA